MSTTLIRSSDQISRQKNALRVPNILVKFIAQVDLKGGLVDVLSVRFRSIPILALKLEGYLLAFFKGCIKHFQSLMGSKFNHHAQIKQIPQYQNVDWISRM